MGNYITETLLEERITKSRLDSLCKVTGSEQATLLSNLIARAEAMVDAYLSTRFKIPVPENALTEEISLAVAEYELYKRGIGGSVPEKIKNSYEKALTLLQNIASGSINIPSDVKPQPANPKGKSMEIKSNTPLMNEGSMGGY